MSHPPRWEPCVSYRAAAAEEFVRDYFGQADRKIKLVAGAGFDPRSTWFPKRLAEAAGNRVSAFFLREERASPQPEYVRKAEANELELRKLIPACGVEKFDIFDIDNAPVGGRRATVLLSQRLAADGATDLIVDASALSVGVFFPVGKFCYQLAEAAKGLNFHLVVLDDPATDTAVRAEPCGKATPLHTFQGGLNLDALTDAAKLWLPQLGPGKQEVLKLVHQLIKPHAVCPILPFPARHPRFPDQLIEEFGELFEAISDPFETTWQVDSRDLVYAHEKSPVDLYRTILRIDDARSQVFNDMGKSQLILSPVGSKALALGILMAALDRDFSVVAVESISYTADSNVLDGAVGLDSELVHIWLHGDAYGTSDKEGRRK
jgi:hypothetical protein